MIKKYPEIKKNKAPAETKSTSISRKITPLPVISSNIIKIKTHNFDVVSTPDYMLEVNKLLNNSHVIPQPGEMDAFMNLHMLVIKHKTGIGAKYLEFEHFLMLQNNLCEGLTWFCKSNPEIQMDFTSYWDLLRSVIRENGPTLRHTPHYRSSLIHNNDYLFTEIKSLPKMLEENYDGSGHFASIFRCYLDQCIAYLIYLDSRN